MPEINPKNNSLATIIDQVNCWRADLYYGNTPQALNLLAKLKNNLKTKTYSPDQKKQVEELVITLSLDLFENLSEGEILDLFKHHLLDGIKLELAQEYDFDSHLKALLFSTEYHLRGELLNQIREQIIHNDQQLGQKELIFSDRDHPEKPTLENWFRDYLLFSGAGPQTSFQITKYLFQSPNPATLTLKEKKILRRAFELNELLKLDPSKVGSFAMFSLPSFGVEGPEAPEKVLPLEVDRAASGEPIDTPPAPLMPEPDVQTNEVPLKSIPDIPFRPDPLTPESAGPLPGAAPAPAVEKAETEVKEAEITMTQPRMTAPPAPQGALPTDIVRPVSPAPAPKKPTPAPGPPQESPVPPKQAAPSQPKISSLKPPVPSIKTSLPKPAPPAKMTPAAKAPGAKPAVVNGVKSLADFSQLTAESLRQTNLKTLQSQINDLLSTSPMDQLTGKQNFQKSPLYQLYIEMGRQSMSSDLTLGQISENMKKTGQPYLTEAEFEAVAQISNQLQ